MRRIGKQHFKYSPTDAVNKTVKSHERNEVQDGRPPPIRERPNQEGTRDVRSTKIRILWTPIRAESRRMQASTSILTIA